MLRSFAGVLILCLSNNVVLAFQTTHAMAVAPSVSLGSIQASGTQRVARWTACHASRLKDLEFRAPKMVDIEPISDLLVECFETELKWFEFPERESRRRRYREMLQKSFLRRIEGDGTDLSFMLMVETSGDKTIVGFVQMGSLPPPPGFQQQYDKQDTSLSESEDEVVQIVATEVKDVPYIANLCVVPSYREAGIGKRMVEICIRWLDKRNVQLEDNVFIAVDYDNFGAKKFYQRNGFQWIEPPGGVTAGSKRDYYFRPIRR